MRSVRLTGVLSLLGLLAFTPAAAPWEAPKSPVIPEASGYVAIPNAAVMPQRAHIYKAIFNATLGADKPTQLLPALDNAGSELNLLGVTGLPLANAKFVVVFHGPAMDGILTDARYRAKFGVPNPNLKVIAEMKRAGVEMFVCGQNLAAENIPPASLTPDVKVASDALIVLMEYQSRGYALLSF